MCTKSIHFGIVQFRDSLKISIIHPGKTVKIFMVEVEFKFEGGLSCTTEI